MGYTTEEFSELPDERQEPWFEYADSLLRGDGGGVEPDRVLLASMLYEIYEGVIPSQADS
ncbi:hypothetical protein R50073_49280 (plasmid) [Maricurvus nonylphenolicus]|jgi:hypothetical protein|uniref:hypothetical protein n=1 Tax=Maricurvus nonylphenolicus TaxID=1008307 RepID=UPI0036F1FE22